MDTKEKKRRAATSGLLSLEASIVLTIFLFLMLYMYSFLVIFEARNEIGHTLLTTADSLALDAFASNTPEDQTIASLLFKLFGGLNDGNGTYTLTNKWYDKKEYNKDANLVPDTIKTRFIAYLAGGDEKEADRVLKSLNIEGGIDALDFSGSYIANGDLYIKVRYKIDYEFKVFGLGSMTFEQSCCSRLWK